MLKRVAIVILCLNVLAAVLIVPASKFVSGAGKLNALSTYRHLDKEGVINHDALADYKDGRYAKSWWDVPPYITGDYLDHMVNMAWVASALFLSNAVVMLLIMRREGWLGSGRNEPQESG